jgi:hypothetical protein
MMRNAGPPASRSWTLPWGSSALLSPGAILSAFAALGVPLLISAVGFATANRLLYPALALFVGGLLYIKRSPWYVGYCLWLFCACALVRRLTDYQAGFQVSSTVLLAPYIACLLAGGSALRYLGTGRNPCSVPLLFVLGTIFYGAVLAVLQGRVSLGITDLLKWSVGPLITVHLLALRSEAAAETRRVVLTALMVASPLMAVYGVWQFISPLPWDADWVINVRQLGFDSVGVPQPFGLRVFGPMQSPGSLAAFLMVGVLVIVGRRAQLSWVLLLPCVLCLALCQYRTLWAATCVGLLLMFLWGTPGTQFKIAVSAGIAVLGLSALALVPEIQYVLLRRFNSLGELEADASGAERLTQYFRFFTEADEPLLGTGFGVNYLSAIAGQKAAALDSGILDIARSFGLFGGLFYLAGLSALIVTMILRRSGGGISSTIFPAAAVACFIQLPLGSIHVAEAGFLGWLVLGAALSTSLSHGRTSRSRQVLRPTGSRMLPENRGLSA